jgi:hypothetical protein
MMAVLALAPASLLYIIPPSRPHSESGQRIQIRQLNRIADEPTPSLATHLDYY